MNFFQRAFAPRSTDDRKPWSSLWPLLFLLWWPGYFGFRAANQNDVASRQQTSFGAIGECGRRGKGNENYCHYSFPVGDEVYRGVSQAAPELEIGQTVVVYYDSQDPRSNALEDFSEKSRETQRFFDISVLVLAAIVIFILWYGPPRRETPDEPNP